MKSILLYCAAVSALLLGTVTAKALGEKDGQVEQSTESPIADMALVDAKVADMQAEPVKAEAMNTSDKEKVKNDSQPHTIADFIIHPLIALKPHVSEGEGKQADTSSTPSPWQLFGFNSGQGLGSQVSSLAGSVTGWLGNRIQLPSLVDTPVRESTTTTTTTTTPKPEVVVRVKQRGSTKKPLISIRGDNDRPYRKTKRPNKFNNWQDEDDEDFDDEEEEEDEFYNNNKRKRYQNNNHGDDDDDDEEEVDDDDEDSDVNNNENDDEDEDNEVAYNNDDDQAEEEEEEEEPPKPVKQTQRRRHPRPLNNRRRVNHNQSNNQRRRFNNNNNNSNASRKQQQQQRRKPYQESEENEQDDEDDEETEPEAESEQQQDFYYNKNPSSKRSQSEQNFIQRGQETLIKQIQQFTGGQKPADVTQTMRKNQKSGNKKQRNQATLIIKRNGQAVYVAPELLQVTDALTGNVKPAGQHISVTSNHGKKPSHYPQPPLTVPYKRKGKPAQYITIPWSQLGISPPDDLTALTNGIQTQPLILNIPQSAIDSMQYPKAGKRKQAITPDSVPLLADASIMDIFKPPRIPPARTPSTMKPIKKVAAQPHGSVVIATKTGPTRIRPGTIVEKAPADENTDESGTSEEASEDEASQQLIVIGDESGERQLTRKEYRKILNFFNQRAGRQLKDQKEQLIPVKVIAAEENAATEVTKIDDKIEMEMEKVPEIPAADSLKQDSEMEMENATEIPVTNSLKQEGEMEMENTTEIPVDSSMNQESGVEMEMENATEIPVDSSLKPESFVDDVTESVVENATVSPVNV